MISEIVHMDESSTEEEVLSELDRLNNDDSVSGILVKFHFQNKFLKQKY